MSAALGTHGWVRLQGLSHVHLVACPLHSEPVTTCPSGAYWRIRARQPLVLHACLTTSDMRTAARQLPQLLCRASGSRSRDGQAPYLACRPEVLEVVHSQVWGVHDHQLKARGLDGAAVGLEQAAQVGPCMVAWLVSMAQAPVTAIRDPVITWGHLCGCLTILTSDACTCSANLLPARDSTAAQALHRYLPAQARRHTAGCGSCGAWTCSPRLGPLSPHPVHGIASGAY